MLTADMKAVIDAASLCFCATVTPDGRPNLSPKGTIRVWDDTRLFFLDIASPQTRANIAHSPWAELNVVDLLSRRGYRFFGRAEVHAVGSDVYNEGLRRVFGDATPTYPVETVVRVTIERTAPLLSPAYWRSADELEIREQWRPRREKLDREFDSHIARVGPTKAQGSGP